VPCQRELEEKVRPLYLQYATADPQERVRLTTLNRSLHVAYLRAGLKGLPQSHQSLDASRPWLCYWVLHGLRLLGEPLEQEAELCTNAVEFLKRCQNADGGFGGGPGQVGGWGLLVVLSHRPCRGLGQG